MKPLRLVMRAFGPFPGEEVVDFRELGDQPFFLIHGVTGSGKTTILDAICLALYGDDPSLARKGSGFRSDYADPRTATEVVFDFALGKDRYRIQRIPQHQRPKLRGEGLRTIPAEATLWRRTHTQDDVQEGELLATQSKNVTPRIEELIGFKCAQFRQVVVLPQGEFRKLLLANSSDRETILERLFDVDVYRRIQAALKQEISQVTETGKRLGVLQKEVLNQCEVEHGAAFMEKVEQIRAANQSATAELTLLKKTADESRAAFENARGNAEKLQEVELAKAEVQQGESQQPRFASDRILLEAARRAQSLIPIKTNLDQRVEEEEEAQKSKAEAHEQLDAATAAQKEAGLTLEVEIANETEREAARAQVLRLTEFRQRAKELENIETELAEAASQLENHKLAFTQVQGELKGTKEELESKREQREGISALAGSHAAKQQALQETKAKLKTWKEFCRLREEVEASGAAVKTADKAVKERSKLLAKAKKREADLREAWQAGQASVLARTLQPQEPCPVCGSSEHPHPAQQTENTPSKEKLDSQRVSLEALEKDLEQAREFAHTTQQTQLALQTQVETLASSLDLEGEEEPGAHLQDLLEQRRKEAEQADVAREQHQRLSEELEGLTEHHKALEKGFAKHQEDLKPVEAKHSEISGRHKERLSALPEELHAAGALDKALEAATSLRDKLEERLTTLREASAKADQHFAQVKTTAKNAAKTEQRCAKQLQKQRETFLAAIAKAEFPDEATFLAAVLDADQIGELDKNLREGEQKFGAAKDRLARATEAASELAPADVTALEQVNQKAQEAFEQATQHKGALDRESETLAKLYQRFQEREEELQQLRTRYSALGDIAEKANGTNRLRLTFQRFVLAAFLDNVLELASVSLHKMSKGRYHLRRANESQDKRSAGGLDLVVFDAQTGAERPVSTLSGGESFLASLALALGLAEVVQHYAGGIKLDAIFIDEGFGTLDADALDLAISTLLELRQGGRMVGVISHVTELRERIQTRLEIVSTRQGSTTHFHLP